MRPFYNSVMFDSDNKKNNNKKVQSSRIADPKVDIYKLYEIPWAEESCRWIRAN